MAVNARKPQPLPNLNDPVVDRHRRFTPTWFRWIKPLLDTTVDLKVNLVATDAQVTANTAAITTEQTVRAGADSALASQISTVSATANSNTAAIQTETSARVNGDSALASQISTVSTTVSGNTTSITSLQSSVNGISAQWGVSINANGRVSGLVRLDGGTSGSTFSVLADKFIVYNPSNDGQSIQGFIIGSVNGTTTVGINGNLLVDGTILARSIVAGTITGDRIAAGTITADRLSVSSLSAIAANVGTVTAGKLQSSDSKFVIDLDNKTITITT